MKRKQMGFVALGIYVMLLAFGAIAVSHEIAVHPQSVQGQK
jgi:hypothetical protein